MSSSKLSDWDDDESNLAPARAAKQEKTVVLKHMFTLQELEVCSCADR
jgi:HIV Tat-specific factor 1